MKIAIEVLFNQYIEGFEAGDTQAVRQCYALPCLLTTPDSIVKLTSETEFKQEFDKIFTGLKDAHFKRVGWRTPSYVEHDKGLFTVAVPWHFFDENGEQFADFTGVYQVAYINSQLQIVSVLSHEQTVCFDNPLTFKTN